MSTEDNKALVRRFNAEVWNQHNVAAADGLLASTYIAHFPGHPPLDREGQKQFIAAYFAAFPDVHATLEDLIADGDKVAFRWTARGRHQGVFQGIPPTGKQVTLSGISIFRLAEGKLVEQWAEFDALGMLQQFGVVPAPGQAGAR
jgi:steroid delta-isomerase-like uncharacterized protein